MPPGGQPEAMLSPTTLIDAVAITRRALDGAGPDRLRTTRPRRRGQDER
jgi:hypothetical protein